MPIGGRIWQAAALKAQFESRPEWFDQDVALFRRPCRSIRTSQQRHLDRARAADSAVAPKRRRERVIRPSWGSMQTLYRNGWHVDNRVFESIRRGSRLSQSASTSRSTAATRMAGTNTRFNDMRCRAAVQRAMWPHAVAARRALLPIVPVVASWRPLIHRYDRLPPTVVWLSSGFQDSATLQGGRAKM